MQKHKKIGFDAKRVFHNNTGLGNYSRDLIKILSNFYPNNKYYLYNPKPKKISRLELTSSIKEVLPKSFLWKKLSSIWRQGPIVNQLKRDEIDIFHGLSGEIPRRLKETKIKSVVTIHDLIFIRYPKLYSFFDRKIHYKKHKYAAKKADKVIAISEQTKRDIVKFLKIDERKVDVIYQGCHKAFKEEASEKEKDILKEKLNLPERYILNVGTIEERKNLLTLIKAIKKLDVNLVVVGRKTKYFNKIKEYINNHNLASRVFFLEGLTVKELSILYQMAEVFVFPSIFEGFGIPIIEALYSKTPVITNKNGVFPEAGGPNSFYVDVNNVDELSNAIEDLISSEEKRQRMGKEGFNFVQKFNDEIIAKKVFNLYQSL